jgi:serine/threonine protein kinase
METTDTNKFSAQKERSGPSQFRHAVILPDGSKPVPLGSGAITSLLGEGGMANVYEIWNAQLEINRAVKLLHPNCSEESKQRFQTEIKITAKLHHPNIIEIHGVGEWNSLPYIEMEKIEGYTLENLIADRGALPIAACTAIGIMISRALNYAHNQEYVIYGIKYNGVIHRDLKPSNIMVCTDGTVKLMDFGIARPTDASIHTTDGSILGTMQYLSPEQLDGIEPDVRTDIYSLGTTLYEAITGVQAFPERNMSKLMMNKIKNEYKPLDDFRVRVPVRLKRLVHRCMMHDRDKRMASAAVLLAELEKIHRSAIDETPEQTIYHLISTKASERQIVSSRRRFPFYKAALGAAALAMVALIAWAANTYRIRASHQARQSASMPQLAVAQEAQAPAAEPSEQPAREENASRRQSAPRRAAPASTTPTSRSRAPAASRPKAAPAPKTLVASLREKHGADDIVSLMEAEYRDESYANVVKLARKLPEEKRDNPQARIYQLRALSRLGNARLLNQFLSAHSVHDGEFYLAKAHMAFEQRRLDEAAALLDKALRAPRAFIDSDQLRRQAYFYQAKIATARFDAAPSEHLYRQAIEAWYQVAAEVRNSPEHSYHGAARTERQRIAQKFRENQG